MGLFIQREKEKHVRCEGLNVKQKTEDEKDEKEKN